MDKVDSLTNAKTFLQHAIIEMVEFLSVYAVLLEVVLVLREVEMLQPCLHFFHGPIRNRFHLVKAQLPLFLFSHDKRRTVCKEVPFTFSPTTSKQY